jgi:hypothetical protein
VIKSRRRRWVGYVASRGERRRAYMVLTGKPEGKRAVGRLRHRYEHNIKIDLKEIGWEVVDWIDLAQDREKWRALVSTTVNLRAP